MAPLDWAGLLCARYTQRINPIPAARSAKAWINQAAFNVPTATDLTIGEGNSPRSALLSQQFYNVDFSVVRRFPIFEKINLEFRAEAFNVLNHTVFGVPVLTVNTPTTFGPGAEHRKQSAPDAVCRQGDVLAPTGSNGPHLLPFPA